MTQDSFWPDGMRSAAAFTFDVDAESAVVWGTPQNARRMSVMSHQAYGPLVGVPRILNLLAEHSITATFFVPGFTAERYPEIVREIAAAGHELGHHGYLHEQPSALSRDQQIAALDRGLDALAHVAGVKPVGYRAPMWDLSWEMPELLLERGFLYDSSLMDGDRPYELAVSSAQPEPASLVEIPIQWTLDDWEQYCFLPEISGSGYIATPDQARALWESELDGLHAVGGCWVLTNHPFLSGRPGRAASLGKLMARVVAMPDVWVAPLRDIARHTRALNLKARSIQPIDVTELDD
ncbi:MAG: polysaccharide deacetylase [Yonghaparkia sp.]|nr:polysaccharide deacetylase [Microcella sp.]